MGRGVRVFLPTIGRDIRYTAGTYVVPPVLHDHTRIDRVFEFVLSISPTVGIGAHCSWHAYRTIRLFVGRR